MSNNEIRIFLIKAESVDFEQYNRRIFTRKLREWLRVL